ncbi:MAG: glycerol kinase [Candidatus Marinimicrobia bacterium CG08_land_8_20_14_0_20_45_22]|nr:MAG: glycerol kinase [Candidatus Marinimicrobia bacterium CG08_land_8_20_14_0_20_45_22]
MYILSIDQGTTGTKASLIDQNCQIVDKSYREFHQIYPKPGWVEHDPLEIWQTVVETIGDVSARHRGEILALGITNQRETTVVWNRKTGLPVYNAIVWQCRRTTEICQSLKPFEPFFREKTGLPIDAYFSGTKIKWILENVPDDPTDLLFGTIDTWLIWKLTNGKVHATDFTNASRTLIYNIRKKCWDEELCRLLSIPMNILPTVKNAIDDFGVVETIPAIDGVPIAGVAGDQQAALFGQNCIKNGEVKNTYGTGCFIMMNTGDRYIASHKGLLTTLAIGGSGEPCYALEGSIFIGGAAIQWLRDELKMIEKASDSEAAAYAVNDNGGVYLVPAFVGLGAPHWDMEARGVLVGLTRGANRNHIIRAALESMAYQTHDVLKTMEEETGISIAKLFVDGGAVANNFLMQFQADIIGCPVFRPLNIESTSLGSAFLAGLKSGFWKSNADLISVKQCDRTFSPEMRDSQRDRLIVGWQKAVRQAKTR